MGKREMNLEDVSFEERQQWIGLGLSIVAIVGYIIAIVIVAAVDDVSFTAVNWKIPMLATLLGAGGIYGIAYGIAKRRHSGPTGDVRDREIERYGEAMTSGLVSFTIFVTLILLALDVDTFWVAHNLFFGSFFGMFVGTAAKVAAYREGVPS